MTAKLQPSRPGDAPPSTLFAATLIGMPGPDLPTAASADAPNPDTVSPDSLVLQASGANPAVPDVVTDIGGLPGEAPDPALAPTLSHIGRYALKRQLGVGGLGAVFEAWDPLLSRAVAVKTLQLDIEHTNRLSLDGLFLNEARAAAGLNHRYIVTIHDAGLSPHGVYIAMERLYGRDLQCALAAGWRPTPEQTVQLVRRIADALAYAHARGVIHCDIKPANIFLQRRDRPKVLDFGIARILHGAALPELDGAVAGSPRYQAPEQLLGAEVDARTDLFSLGTVMYELLAGRRAFEGATLGQIHQAVLAGPPPLREVAPAVPPEIAAMVARLMAPAPADRYTCAGELSADLRRWILAQQGHQGHQGQHGHQRGHSQSHAQAAAAPAAAAPAARPRRRAGPSPWLLGGGLLLAAAAAGALVLRGHEPVPPPTAPAAAAAEQARTAAAAPIATAAAVAPQPVPAATAATAAMAEPPAEPPAAMPTPPAPAAAIDGRPRKRAAPAAEPIARDGRGDATAAPRPTAAAAAGVVNLAVSPWAEVEVDGAAGGTTPPLNRLSLPEGQHSITLRNADFAPHTVQVQVSADKPLTLRHRFGP
ncbi:MAG: serine/threonine-protein kinase [Rubrivivax sp.]